MKFSPDGHTLATASGDKTAQLWDISDVHHPHPLSTLTGDVISLAFSPNGCVLATANGDKTARLWDVSDPHHSYPLGTLTGHAERVVSVAFSRDGQSLATGSSDDTARLWETNPDKAVARICATAWPMITKSEWTQYLTDLPYQPPCHSVN